MKNQKKSGKGKSKSGSNNETKKLSLNAFVRKVYGQTAEVLSVEKKLNDADGRLEVKIHQNVGNTTPVTVFYITEEVLRARGFSAVVEF